MLDAGTLKDLEYFVQSGPVILVTVAQAKGSTPRVAGTSMLVSASDALGTIGGGQLEFMAMDAAREMLTKGQQERALDIPLGPEIGQCCGGHVFVQLTHLTKDKAGSLADTVRADLADRPRIFIFGAGHVGRALAKAMSALPVQSLLVDNREEELAAVSDDIPTSLTPLPETHIRSAPSGSAFIILTHDHALDFLLTREALNRKDAAYVGMIGSKTKRATFASWLERETGSRHAMTGLTMPIGTSRLTDKRPAVIAAMVAAQVMEAVGTYQKSEVPA